tara:strand:+ start:22 stop:798 length:777 start_codon:yes stop_codon:yes gene_type:complete
MYLSVFDKTMPRLTHKDAQKRTLYTSALSIVHIVFQHAPNLSLTAKVIIRITLAGAFVMNGHGITHLIDQARFTMHRLVVARLHTKGVPAERILTFICRALHMPHPGSSGFTLSTKTISDHLYHEYLHDTFEMRRRIRISPRDDRAMLTLVSAAYDKSDKCRMILPRAIYDNWVYRAAQTISNSDSRTISNSVRRATRHWTASRKRKRAATERLVRGDCAICFDSTTVVETQCKHHFCEPCLNKVTSNTCPMCRQQLC